jgi:restriction system protein
MADITISRIGELLRSVLELLWHKSEGLSAKEIIASLPDITLLPGYEPVSALPLTVPIHERIFGLAIIPLVKAGWLIKNNKGCWQITEEGRQACNRFPNAQELYKDALRQVGENRQIVPTFGMAAEEAEEMAWEQIHGYLQEKTRSEFQTMVADLLKALGYYVAWIAPPEKDRGQVDIVAYVDPLGVNGPRILIQVKYKGQAVTLDGLNSFLSVLGANDYGLLVSSPGFTSEVKEQMGKGALHKTTLLDLETLFDLWVLSYDQLSLEARSCLPLKPIHFLSGIES